MFGLCPFFVNFASTNKQMGTPIFKFIALREASEFIASLSPEVRKKIYYNIRKIHGGVKDAELLVITTHGMVKKTQKTPENEIAKAEAIRKRYFETKDQQR